VHSHSFQLRSSQHFGFPSYNICFLFIAPAGIPKNSPSLTRLTGWMKLFPPTICPMLLIYHIFLLPNNRSILLRKKKLRMIVLGVKALRMRWMSRKLPALIQRMVLLPSDDSLQTRRETGEYSFI
jgi:hypothetical protein